VDSAGDRFHVAKVTRRRFEKSSSKFTKEIGMVSCACNSSCVGVMPVILESCANSGGEHFKWGHKGLSVVTAVHCNVIMIHGILCHCDNFIGSDFNGLHSINNGAAEGVMMSNMRMNMEDVADHASDMVTDGVSHDEHFVLFQPRKNGCFSIGCLLNFGDGFCAVDDAADGYLVGIFACRWMNQKELFEFFLIFRKLVVSWII